MLFNEKLGKFLAQQRIQNKLTQEQLAEKLNIDKKKISRWECGTSAPEFEIIIDLSEIFNISILEIANCEVCTDSEIKKRINITINTLKELRLFKLKQKILLVLGIILGLFFGLCTAFTITNYHTVEVYTIKSLDENFAILGNYTKAGDYKVFNVINLGYLQNKTNSLDLNIDVYDIEYEVLKGTKRVFSIKPNPQTNDNKTKANLLEVINNTVFNEENFALNINDESDLIFKIFYRDKNKNAHTISFPIKLIAKFDN